MRKKWFVASMLAVLACFAIPHPGEAEAPSPSWGKETFQKRCGGCHSPDRDKEGPRLRRVYRRPSGSGSSLHYSAAAQGADVRWGAEPLHHTLAAPGKLLTAF